MHESHSLHVQCVHVYVEVREPPQAGVDYLYLEIESLIWNPGLVKQVRLAVG